MKRLVLAALLACLAAPTALADGQNALWLGIGVETGIMRGTTASWPNIHDGLCGAQFDPPGTGNCVFIPRGRTITHVYGTMTLKSDTVELLTAVVCGNGQDWRTIWAGHGVVKGTIVVITPKLIPDYHLVGDGDQACWVMWQAVNSGTYTGSGRGAEWQLTFTAQ